MVLHRGRGRGKAKSKGSAEGDSVQDSDAEEAGNDDSEIMEPGRIPATAGELILHRTKYTSHVPSTSMYLILPVYLPTSQLLSASVQLDHENDRSGGNGG